MKRSIKTKLFLVFLAVLSINIVVVLLFGGTLLETFYVRSTMRRLEDHQKDIQAAYNRSDDSLTEALGDCAVDNITVVVYDARSMQMLYNTARPQNGESVSGIDPRMWLQQAYRENVFNRLDTTSPIVQAADNEVSNSIYLYARLADDTYLMMETPREYIASTAKMAMEFFVAVSLLTLAVGGVLIYFVARRISRPIREIDTAAKKISQMDLSARCHVHTGDEIEALAGSVNKMADELQKNIGLLRRDLEREEQTNKLRREFIANVSHDLKTPLALVSSYSEALADGSVGQLEVVEVLQEQCSRMDRLVNQMLTLSRLESGVIQYDMTVFSVEELIDSVTQGFRLSIRNKGIALKTDVQSGCIVEGDFNRVSQALTNLVENAIKYVDDRKKIRISAGQGDGFAQISVFNTFPPMQQQQLDNLFEMFYKTDQSRESGEKSYGIGLAIVKNIIQAHGGSCGVRNLPGGICFWFTLKSVDFDDEPEDSGKEPPE